jgi:hypothetical protein
VRRLLPLILVLSACREGEPARPAPSPAPRATGSAGPTPASEAEQRARCLTYTVERETQGESRRVRVRVKNACAFEIPADQTRFEITATPLDGQGVLGTATGSFSTSIPPNSEGVETSLDVDCPSDVGGCRYFVTAL